MACALGCSGSHKNDLHEYDIASGAWTDLSSPRDGGTPAVRHRMAFAESNGKLYVFGASYGIFACCPAPPLTPTLICFVHSPSLHSTCPPRIEPTHVQAYLPVYPVAFIFPLSLWLWISPSSRAA
eukprot:2306927-Rhodomonas_salina.1